MLTMSLIKTPDTSHLTFKGIKNTSFEEFEIFRVSKYGRPEVQWTFYKTNILTMCLMSTEMLYITHKIQD